MIHLIAHVLRPKIWDNNNFTLKELSFEFMWDNISKGLFYIFMSVPDRE